METAPGWHLHSPLAPSGGQSEVGATFFLFLHPPRPGSLTGGGWLGRDLCLPEEQLESHDAMLQSILDDLDDHQMTFPDRKWKAKDFEEYKLKQEYFEYE
ncbi:hypothetical protein chiPu_0024746, partial [Chiloscyllium punctatum]|nr:hypothetical protein [Chiloscyllium punctatum]